jgi:cobalamin biosynthesis protein CobT
MFDTERDFDKDVGETLSDSAKKEIGDSKYAVFSTEWDKTIPAPLANDKISSTKMEAGIRDKIGVMQKQLERAMAAKARKSWNPGQVRGRIAPGSLFKTAAGDDRVFRKRHETKAISTAVSLVVDCSGSMSGSKITLAGTAAYALSAVLERLKITYEVIGFTTLASGEMLTLIRDDAESHKSSLRDMSWGRIEPIYMPVFKSFSGKLDTAAVSRMAHLTEGPDWLSQNVDGESVQLAARRLVQQRAERHIMIVLSDGQPCCSMGRRLEEHLKATVKNLEKQNVEMIGIGIRDRSVTNFYPKSVVLNDVEELPTRVMAELTKLLLS